jgi:hypothetical protein
MMSGRHSGILSRGFCIEHTLDRMELILLFAAALMLIFVAGTWARNLMVSDTPIMNVEITVPPRSTAILTNTSWSASISWQRRTVWNGAPS